MRNKVEFWYKNSYHIEVNIIKVSVRMAIKCRPLKSPGFGYKEHFEITQC